MSALPAMPMPAPEAEAVHGGDHRHLAVVDRGEGGEAAAVGADQGLVALGLDLLDVHPGAEPPALGPEHTTRLSRHPAGGGHGVGQGEPARPRRGR